MFSKSNVAKIMVGILMGLALGCTWCFAADELVKAQDGSGYFGYKDTPKLPWCGYVVHDPDRPAPPRVDPGPASTCLLPVPAEAIRLFDGNDLSAWEKPDWKVVDGILEAGGSTLSTKESFGSFQLHLEWMAPANFEGPWYNQGNNGVGLHGIYEIQIFDSYNVKIYPDGLAAAIYGQTPPRVNVCRPPGQWQTYDIVLTAPTFKGKQVDQLPRVTVFHNGVLVHLNQEIYGATGHRVLPRLDLVVAKGPLHLMGHGCPVRFRNIWLRPL
jgi:hypothetical protein